MKYFGACPAERWHIIVVGYSATVCTAMSADVSEKGDCHNLVFSVQIGLEREAVTVALGGAAEFTMSTLTEIACAFVDRKVSVVAGSFKRSFS